MPETIELPADAACRAIAEQAEHCAFMAAAMPPNEATLIYLGQQMCEIMDIAREGIGLEVKGWANG